MRSKEDLLVLGRRARGFLSSRTAMLATLTLLALPLLPASSVAALTGSTSASVPAPDILNVDFADGTPADHAQGLAPQTWGAPAVAKAALLGKDAATFNGTTDGFSYPLSGQWSKLTSGFSLDCQFRYNGGTLPTGSATAGICGDAYAGGAVIEAYSGQVAFAVEVDGVYIFTTAPIKPGTWYDIVGTWDGNNADLYIDGALAMSAPASGTLTIPRSDAQNYYLGANADLSNGMRGPSPSSVSVAGIWSSALTASQVAAEYQQSTVPPVTAPAPDILNVNFTSGSPVDYAQGKPYTSWGAPTIANDPAQGESVASFNGSSGYTFPSNPDWSRMAAGLSIECVFKYNGAIPTTTQNVICGDTHSGGFSIINNDGQLALQINTAGSYKFAQAPFVTGQWYDAVGTWDGSNARLYINGQLAGIASVSGALTTPSVADFTVGADAPQGGAVNFTSTSSVAAYKVWDSALSSAQVAANYSRPAPASAAPDPSVLNVNFADAAPIDYAQGLAETTYGTPVIAIDPTLNKNAATFNGSSGYTFDSSAQWGRLANGFSIECEFKYNGAIPTTTQNVICGDTHSGGFSIINNDGQLALQVNTAGSYKFAQAPFVTGQWYDVMGTWDGSTARLYINGQLAATTAVAGSLTNPSVDDFTVGADAPQGGNVNFTSTSTVHQYKIWDTVLSAGQVEATTVHDVTVNTSGKGTASASVPKAADGETVTLTELPAPGYHFTGWTATPSSVAVGADGTFAMPGQDVTVTAAFAPNTYTVHFDGNGADGGATADQTQTYDSSATLTANGYTDSGHYFAGWATTPGGPPAYDDGQSVQNLTATDGGSVTLYAVWIVNGNYVVRVASSAHGTASADTFSHSPGDAVTLTDTPDTGYHLADWKVTSPSDGSVTVAANGTFTMPGKDVTLTAEFAANTYTVHYDGNGADDGAMPDGSFTYDQAAALAPNGFARDNYRFAGWSTAATGPVAYPDMVTVSNLTAVNGATVTLYAQWSKLTVQPGSWPSMPAGFVTANVHLPGVPVSGAVSQPLLGLWNGTAPTSFTKISGDSWLNVTADGTVTGTAPASVPQNAGEIAVAASNGTTASQILVEVPVDALHASPQVKTASWNAWEDGGHVTDAVGKNLAVIASQGIDVAGFQGGGYAMAQSVGAALGWQVHGDGDLGIVSAYPVTTAKTVFPTSSVPAAAVTVDVAGNPVRVWDVHLDESNYGPYNACFTGATSPSTLIADEESTARYAQAKAVAHAMAQDINSSTPVVMFGDLASPSGADWTAATSGLHCNAGAVDWPVPDVFAAAGLTDTFRVANPDPLANPGTTWSPVITTNANGQKEPQDRIDYVDYTTAGGLTVQESHALTVGRPAPSVAGNSWASDHAAVVTTFTVHGTSPGPVPQPVPTVTVAHDTIAYQVGGGPADDSAFLSDVGVAATPAGTSIFAVDLSKVDFTTPGWYTALVTATRKGVVSDPVAVTVRVAPVPGLVLGSATATLKAGDTVTEAAVLAQLEPVLDVYGAVQVDLAGVNNAVPGNYPVAVTATDAWGFTVTQPATVTIG